MADPNQKQNEQQKPQADQRSAQPAQQPAPQAEKREYVAKTKIVQGGRANRKVIAVGTTMRLTSDEAKRLGDAVALKRDDGADR